MELLSEIVLTSRKKKKYYHGAFLLKGRKTIVYQGFNDPYRGYIDGKHCTSLHAEIDCLRKAKNATRFKFLVVRVSPEDGTYKNSLPCAYCRDALMEQGFTSIYCSNEEGNVVKVNLTEIPRRVTKSQQLFKEKLYSKDLT